ncbi:hypothetical protein GCM10009789_87040 [Kribbella sancticallisti]|uniref:N-acetyltransferase domain-containing protein n=1 Tax=Kribbella sancticallisti TaxID=460087 RepID=A0ABP4QWB2_9ACTN
MDGRRPRFEAEDRALFRRIFTKAYAHNLFDVWAVRRDGLLIGHAEIKPTDVVQGYQIIYALAPDVWGSGLGKRWPKRLSPTASTLSG